MRLQSTAPYGPHRWNRTVLDVRSNVRFQGVPSGPTLRVVRRKGEWSAWDVKSSFVGAPSSNRLRNSAFPAESGYERLQRLQPVPVATEHMAVLCTPAHVHYAVHFPVGSAGGWSGRVDPINREPDRNRAFVHMSDRYQWAVRRSTFWSVRIARRSLVRLNVQFQGWAQPPSSYTVRLT